MAKNKAANAGRLVIVGDSDNTSYTPMIITLITSDINPPDEVFSRRQKLSRAYRKVADAAL